MVALLQAGFVGVEAVGVLHIEFPHPNEAGSGARFVSELGLDLVQDEGQVAVALDVGFDYVGDHLFMGGRQHHGAAPPVLEGEHIVAEGLSPAGLVPQLLWLERGHHQLLAAGGVYLFPDYVFNLTDRPQGQRQVGIDPGGHLLDQSGAKHQPVAGGFGVGRVRP